MFGKKGKIEVQIARQGQDAETIRVRLDATVSAALEEAGISMKDTESIRVNKSNADLETKLKNGDRIILTKNIKGGK